MGIRFERSAFQKAFSTVAKASNGKTKAILGNVRVKAQDGNATLYATDTEMFVEVSIECEGSGDFLLPVSRTSAILAECGDEAVTIEPSKNGIRFDADKASFELQASDPAEFPVSPSPPSGSLELTVNAQGLRAALRSTDFAVDESSTRYQLGGVGMDIGAGLITCVATDGRRLAAFELSTIGEHKPGGTIPIVPAKACKIIETAVGEVDGPAKLVVGLNLMRIEFEGVAVTTTLIEGRFPNWRMVEPSIEGATSLDFVAKVLYAAVRQASIVSDAESRSVQFHVVEGELRLSASTADVGSSVVTVPIAYTGEPISVSLDSRFVTDFCRIIDPMQTITIHVTDDDKPVLMRSGDARYTVMPMKRS